MPMSRAELEKLSARIRKNLAGQRISEKSVRMWRLQIGRDLIKAQAALPYGEFLPWVAAEFSMSQRSAYNYIHEAKSTDQLQGRGIEFAKLASLPAKDVVALAKASEKAIRTVAAKAAAGEKITAPVVHKLLKVKKEPASDDIAAETCVEFLLTALGSKGEKFLSLYAQTTPAAFNRILRDMITDVAEAA